jgi:hypothetical protein
VAPTLGTAFDGLLGKALATDPADRPGLNAFTAGLVAALAAEEPAALPAAGAVATMGANTAVAPASRRDPLEETERITLPAGATLAAPIPPPPPRSAQASRQRNRRTPSTATILLAAALVAAAVLLSLGNRLPGAASASASASPPGATPSPIVAPSPTSLASPSPTPDPAAPALAALGEVVNAINAAKGGHDGLNGKTAGELLDLVGVVRGALESEDMAAARRAADRLADRADKATKGLNKERATALSDAIATLVDAIPA